LKSGKLLRKEQKLKISTDGYDHDFLTSFTPRLPLTALEKDTGEVSTLFGAQLVSLTPKSVSLPILSQQPTFARRHAPYAFKGSANDRKL